MKKTGTRKAGELGLDLTDFPDFGENVDHTKTARMVIDLEAVDLELVTRESNASKLRKQRSTLDAVSHGDTVEHKTPFQLLSSILSPDTRGGGPIEIVQCIVQQFMV